MLVLVKSKAEFRNGTDQLPEVGTLEVHCTLMIHKKQFPGISRCPKLEDGILLFNCTLLAIKLVKPLF